MMETRRCLVHLVLATQDSNVWETHNYWQHREKQFTSQAFSSGSETYIELAAIPAGKERSGAISGWNSGGMGGQFRCDVWCEGCIRPSGKSHREIRIWEMWADVQFVQAWQHNLLHESETTGTNVQMNAARSSAWSGHSATTQPHWCDRAWRQSHAFTSLALWARGISRARNRAAQTPNWRTPIDEQNVPFVRSQINFHMQDEMSGNSTPR